RIEEQKRQAEVERKRIEQEKRKAEAERQRIEEEKRRAEAERQRIEEEKRRAEAERQRIEEEKRRAETERKRVEEEKRRAEAERKRIEEQKRRQQAELAMQAELAEEELILKRRRQSLRQRNFNQYVASIQDKVQRVWRRPLGVPKGLSCTIRVAQIPGGEVVSATVTQSSGNVEFDRSVEAAVLKASPLPRPRDPDLFEREIKFIFQPED
ncbi:MAG: cell envelope integrity protein TolA, partial [Gammaproteobacteria bacterium]|nr:cell envelope integrity protein TolA [Gammaproteobacteria bacterium]